MDLKFHGKKPTVEERAAVDALLGPAESGWHGGERVPERDAYAARGGLQAVKDLRDRLLPALHALQDRAGWVSEGGLEYVCRRLSVPPAEAWGVVTFYHLLATSPQPPVVAHVCDDLACRLAGAETLCADLARELGPEGRPSRDGRATWKRSPCLGLCERAPAALVIAAGPERQAGALAPARGAHHLQRALEGNVTEALQLRDVHLAAIRRWVPQAGQRWTRLLSRIGVVDPTRLDAYRASGGYVALARALARGPEWVIGEVVASKLLGRGGAAFPTGRKWDAVARATGRPKYIICNADESEPGTFKDRILLEEEPFVIVESMTIAGFACGAERGYVYLRGEYPLAEERLAAAIAQARAADLLGGSVLESGFRFDIEIRRGGGAYICGEETALMNSIEGRRGEPRSKPPFPVEVGLFGCPTAINNVETLINIPWIVVEGGAAFAAIGTPGSTGTKLFCVAGRVNRPGLYEIHFGETLGDLIERGGGVGGSGELKAVLLGGAAGAFVGPEALDTPLTFEGLKAIGATLGSGVVLVYDTSADLGDALERIAAFFRHESCGQCVPCRVGTVRQQEIVARLRAAKPLGGAEQELALFRELSQAMRDASICGLGQTASSAIESALRFAPFERAAAGAPE